MTPLGEVTYAREGGVSVKKDGLELNFSYESLPGQLDEDTRDFLNLIPGKGSKLNDIRILRDFKLRKDGHILDLSEILPRGSSVYFDPTREGLVDINFQTIDSSYLRKIMLFGDLTRVGNIASLIHEAGHLDDLNPDKNPQWALEVARAKIAVSGLPNFFSRERVVRPREGALDLEAERNAWAFALRRLKPFFDETKDYFDNDAILQLVHRSSLKTYSDDIEKDLVKV